jgi:hypothetical protein
VPEITHVRSIRKPLIETEGFELVISTAEGDLHEMPPNISNVTRPAHLLVALRTQNPAITFEETHVK